MVVGPEKPPYDYGKARSIAGLVLIFAAVALTLLDVISLDYATDSIVLGLMLGTGVVLLGVETGQKLFPPRP